MLQPPPSAARLARLALRLALCALAACQGAQASSAADAAAPAAPAYAPSSATVVGLYDLGEALGEAACAQLARCGPVVARHLPGALVTGLAGGAADGAACSRAMEAHFAPYAQRIAHSLLQGRAAYDGSAAKRCLQAVQGLGCAAYAAQQARGAAAGSDCDAWLRPAVPQGGACGDDYECATDYCAGRPASRAGVLQDGHCAAKPGLGAACDGVCAAGAFCDDAAPHRPTCAALLPLGGRCTEHGMCASGTCAPGRGRSAGHCID